MHLHFSALRCKTVQLNFIVIAFEGCCCISVDMTRWADGPATEANRVKEAGAINKSLSGLRNTQHFLSPSREAAPSAC